MKTVNFLSGVLVAMALCGPVSAAPADYNVVPMPQSVVLAKGAAFQLSADVQILAAPGLQREAEFLQQYLREVAGVQLNITDKREKKQRYIELALGKQDAKKEQYTLTVSAKGIRIEGGSAAGVFYGYKTNGVYTNQAEADADGYYQVNDRDQKEYFAAGDIRFVDKDNNGVIDDNDRFVIGDPNPDVYGNIYTRFNWKNWSLNATFRYSLGNDVYNYQRSLLEGGSRFYNQTTAMLSRWTSENQQTDIPRICYGDPMGNSRFSDRWIEDGSYLRLSNVTLSYSIPIRSTYLQGITLWGGAYNLFTITRYLGSDPNCGVSGSALLQGIDRGLQANARSFALGVKVNL